MSSTYFPISTASFSSASWTYDPLVASETISQSAPIAPSLGVLKRGTVLYGPAVGTPITAATPLTTVVGTASPRGILAQDIDTGTGGNVMGLIYTQGKFLDTGITFSSKGAAFDAANLWDIGIYVLTVLQTNGQLVPMISLPATGGPLPQMMAAKDAEEMFKQDVEAIKAAQGTPLPGDLNAPLRTQPAWYAAQFGEEELTPEQEARKQNAEEASDMMAKQEKALADLDQKQQEERSKLLSQQHEEQKKFAAK